MKNLKCRNLLLFSVMLLLSNFTFSKTLDSHVASEIFAMHFSDKSSAAIVSKYYCSSRANFDKSLFFKKELDPIITTQPEGQTVCDGSSFELSIIVDNTNGPPTYAWYKEGVLLNTGSATTNTLTIAQAHASDAGSYVCRVMQDGVTVNSDAAEVVVNSVNLIVYSPTAVCAPATIDLSVAGVTSGSESGLTFTYWKDLAATVPLTNYTAITTPGACYIKGTSANGCSKVLAVTLTFHTSPVVSIHNPAEVCPSETVDLTATAVTAGSSPSLVLTYYSDAAATIPLAAPKSISAAGTYYIKGTNSNGCFDIKAVTVSFIPLPNLLITSPSACIPETVDLSSFAVTAGSDSDLALSYWQDSAASVGLANYTALSSSGTYYIKATNLVTNCFVIKAVLVKINSLPNLVLNSPPAVCPPATIDLSAATITSGSDSGLLFTYWKDLAATVALTNYSTIATSGSYYIKGTNADGCSSVRIVTVTVNPAPTLNIHNPPEVCASETVDLTAAAVTSGSSTSLDFTYYSDAAATAVLSNPSSIISPAGTYYIKGINSNGCFVIKAVTVTFTPLPNLVLSDPVAVCGQDTVDLSSLPVTAGSDSDLELSYWQDAAATIGLTNYTAISSSGNYYIKGTNLVTNCSVIKPVFVRINSLPNLVVNTPLALCSPATIDLSAAAITSSSASGLSFSYWQDLAATVALTNYTAIGTSGTYYIKGTNANGCSSIKAVTIMVNLLPTLIINNPAPGCASEAVDLTAAEVTSGSSTSLVFTYYSDAATTAGLPNPASISSAGTYYIKGTNSSGCFVIKAVPVSFTSLPNLVLTKPAAVCASETVDLSSLPITAGSDSDLELSYWQDAAATIALANYRTISSSGNYYIKGTNLATNCYVIKSVVVQIHSLPKLEVNSPSAVCSPATIDLSAAAITSDSASGLTFTYWRDSGATNGLTNYTALGTTGTYYIKGTNADGCFSIKAVTVTVNLPPILTLHNPAAGCASEAVDLTAAAVTGGSSASLGFTYYSDAAATAALPNPTGISSAGTYYIKGTNNNGCFVIKSVTVSFTSLPNLVLTKPATVCASETIDLSSLAVTAGSDSDLELSYWQDAAATIGLANYRTISSSGNYYIKGTNLATNCFVIKSVVVQFNSLPNLVVNLPTSVCSPATIDLSEASITSGSASGLIFTYWRDSAATNGLTNYNALGSSGTYYIKGTNANGCFSIKAVTVTINLPPTLNLHNPAAGCASEAVDLTSATVTSGSSASLMFTYYSDAAATIALANPASISTAGTYYIKGSNSNGCFVIKGVTVSFVSLPNLVITSPSAVCATETVDISSLPVRAGSDSDLVLSYWQDSAATIGLLNYTAISSSGNYYIKGTNLATNCSVIKSVLVRINNLPNLVVNSPPAVCFPTTIVLSAASITSGSASGLTFTYWRDPDATIGLPNYNAIRISGTYYIKGTNANGCSSVQGVTVTVNLPPTLNIHDPAAGCASETVDITTAAVTAGSSASLAFTYYSDAAATAVLPNPSSISTAGTYYIKGSNSNGCFEIKAVTVSFTSLPNLILNNPAAVCATEIVDLSSLAVTSGSDGNLELSYWQDTLATIELANYRTISRSGNYYIKGTNLATNCFVIKAVTVQINSLPNLVVTLPLAICFPTTFDLSAASITAGSASGLTFSYWRDSAATIGLTNYNAISTSGIYYIKASNANGCSSIQGVTVTINLPPTLIIHNPPIACASETVDLTATAVTSGSSPSLNFTYYSDAAVTLVLANPATISTAGTYYIKGSNSNGCWVVRPVVVEKSVKIIFLPDSGPIIQSVCKSGLIVPITFIIEGNAKLINSILLPSGMTLSQNTVTGIYTIQGSPTQSGVFTIPISTMDCLETISIVITNVTTSGAINLTSVVGTDNQAICQMGSSSAIIPIDYEVIGANAVTVTGLPAGLVSFFNPATGILNISGTPMESGIFNYKIETSPCSFIKNGVLKISSPLFLTNVTVTDVTCGNGTDGAIALTINGGYSSSGSYSVRWTGPNGYQQSQASITGLASGQYTISVTDAIGCIMPSVTYTVLPAVPVMISLQSITNINCNGTLGCASFNFTGGTGIYTYLLQYLDPVYKVLNTIIPANNNYFSFCNLKAGQYYLTLKDSKNCSTNPYSFTIYDYGSLSIEALSLDTKLCSDGPGKVRIKVATLDSNLSFFYNSDVVLSTSLGNGIYELLINNPTVPSGIIKVKNGQNCWAAQTVGTTLLSPDFEYTSPDLEDYGFSSVNEIITFVNGVDLDNIPAEYDHIAWDFGDNTTSKLFYPDNLALAEDNFKTVSHTYTTDGTYPVTLTVFNSVGCFKSITKTIVVGKPTIIVANAFTPNNDGINDLFRPSIIGLKEVAMYVYDGWGNTIYEVTSEVALLDANNWGWNGIEKGKSEATNGLYRYYIRAKTINEQIIEKAGGILLIK